MKVIGIAGRARSGKDTAGKVITSRGRIVRRALADCLKEDVAALGLATLEECYSKADPRVRRILQIWGTEHGRCIDPDYWFLRWSHWALRYKATHPHTEGFAITDIRYPNEGLIPLDKFNGYLLYINADDRLTTRIQPHTSESHFAELKRMALDHPRGKVIQNNGTEDDFRLAVIGCLNEWGL